MTITEGTDSYQERQNKLDKIIEDTRQEYLNSLVPGGYCGICKVRYKGNHSEHKCNLKKW